MILHKRCRYTPEFRASDELFGKAMGKAQEVRDYLRINFRTGMAKGGRIMVAMTIKTL